MKEGEMTSEHQTARNLRALLIGIDCYLPNELSDGTFYRSLAGCVRDILAVEQFLHDQFGLTDDRIIRLTASRPNRDHSSSRGGEVKQSSSGDEERPTEPPEQWPTYDNIVQAFRKLEESALPGEQIYIHYSGHGGKVKTLPGHREFIPDKLIDEALVPMDLGNDEGRYLRDIELAFLLQKLVDKGLYVTIVLDSCHSGSATRAWGPGPANKDNVRGSATIDNRPRPSLVASDEELAKHWKRLAELDERDFFVGSGWLPDPQGYVLLAACRSNEGAHEYAFDGLNKRGALTYWFLASLKKFGDGVTYRRLHRYIHANVSEQFRKPEPQNPQLEGEGDRVLFGRETAPWPYVFVVVKVDEAFSQVTLSTGRVHGLGAGARFALYSANEVHLRDSHTRLAIAEIIEPGISSSPAQLVSQSSQRKIKGGDQAVLLAPGTDTPRYTVKVPELPESAAAREQLVQLLRRYNEGRLQLIEEGEPDFIATIDQDEYFRICDSSGAEIPNISPCLRVAEAGAPQRVVQRLEHLAKYRSVLELENFDPLSPLLRKFSVELLGVQSDYKSGVRMNPRPVTEVRGKASVSVDEWIFLRARNHYTEQDATTLNITVLDLRPDWSIQQVFPSRAGLFDTLEAAQELSVPLCAALPHGYNEGVDVIKIISTTKPVDFHFFELPSLNNPAAPNETAQDEGSSRDVLRGSEHSSDELQTRDMVVPSYQGHDWTTRQFEIRITR
jgi:hypothetical protein